MADNENKTKRGYAVDLVNKIFETINKDLGTEFVPEFHEVYDKNYGNPIEGTKKWNGLIGELLTHVSSIKKVLFMEYILEINKNYFLRNIVIDTDRRFRDLMNLSIYIHK